MCHWKCTIPRSLSEIFPQGQKTFLVAFSIYRIEICLFPLVWELDEKEDRAVTSLTVAWKRKFQPVLLSAQATPAEVSSSTLLWNVQGHWLTSSFSFGCPTPGIFQSKASLLSGELDYIKAHPITSWNSIHVKTLTSLVGCTTRQGWGLGSQDSLSSWI